MDLCLFLFFYLQFTVYDTPLEYFFLNIAIWNFANGVDYAILGFRSFHIIAYVDY